MVIREQRFSFNHVRQVLGGVLDHDLHAKRVNSLCDATLGVLRSASLAVCMIGQGLAAARGLNAKHATKQVDRLLSNPMINVDDILVRWVPYVVGARNAIVVALDWTDFDADKQATIMLSLITDHGRATPLVWLTVNKDTLKNNRSRYEHRVLVRLAELLPADIKVCVVADRGFGDQKLYRVLTEELYFDYIIRFRGNIAVTATTGETRTAAAWVRPGGRARVLRGAAVTADRYAVGTVVCAGQRPRRPGGGDPNSGNGGPRRSWRSNAGRRQPLETSCAARSQGPHRRRSYPCGAAAAGSEARSGQSRWLINGIYRRPGRPRIRRQSPTGTGSMGQQIGCRK